MLPITSTKILSSNLKIIQATLKTKIIFLKKDTLSLSYFGKNNTHFYIIGIANLFEQLHRKIVFLLLDQTYRFFVNTTSKRKITIGFVLTSKMLIDISAQAGCKNFGHTAKLPNIKNNNAEYIPYFLYLCLSLRLLTCNNLNQK